MTVKALADLGQGARGRIVELRLPPGRRTSPQSPLQPGASVYMAEATGGRWLHVRIDYREYSIPLGVAEGVLIELPEREQPPSAADAYAVLVSRLERRSWRVRVIDRPAGWSCAASGSRRRRPPPSATPSWPPTPPPWTRPRSGPATGCPDPGGAGSRTCSGPLAPTGWDRRRQGPTAGGRAHPSGRGHHHQG